MRSSLGLAFGPAGRLGLFLFLALCSAPAIHCDHTTLECYASGGAVAFLIVSALLQSWMLSCAPEYRGTVVASLETQKIKTDSTPDVFPQIYQRDEGTHLHHHDQRGQCAEAQDDPELHRDCKSGSTGARSEQ